MGKSINESIGKIREIYEEKYKDKFVMEYKEINAILNTKSSQYKDVYNFLKEITEYIFINDVRLVEGNLQDDMRVFITHFKDEKNKLRVGRIFGFLKIKKYNKKYHNDLLELYKKTENDDYKKAILIKIVSSDNLKIFSGESYDDEFIAEILKTCFQLLKEKIKSKPIVKDNFEDLHVFNYIYTKVFCLGKYEDKNLCGKILALLYSCIPFDYDLEEEEIYRDMKIRKISIEVYREMWGHDVNGVVL